MTSPFDSYNLVGCATIAGLLVLALSIRRSPIFGAYTFTMSIFAGVAAALFFPHLFIAWNGFKLSALIVPLIQIIMR